jgi:uncharacterized protein (TIGR02147 family)
VSVTFNNYRELLKFEFETRHRQNAAYSLRAFARDLGLSPSRLSEILQGKQGLSPTRAREVGRRLGFKEEKLDWFCKLVQAQSARSSTVREFATTSLLDYQDGVKSAEIDLSSLDFEVKWFHLAIRRMTLLTQFQKDPAWIAAQLGLKFEVAAQAIKDLLRHRLLQIEESTGRMARINNFVFGRSLRGRTAVSKMFRYLFYQAYQKRKSTPSPLTRTGGHLLTIDKALYPELLDLIKDFEDKVDHLTYKSEAHDTLIAVVVGAYPLIEPPAEKKAESERGPALSPPKQTSPHQEPMPNKQALSSPPNSGLI